MRNSVDFFVGSEELEPVEGWPYDTFLEKWTQNPMMSPADVSKLLSREYLQAYSGGIYGKDSVTMSALDLNYLGDFNSSLKIFSTELLQLEKKQKQDLIGVARNSQSFGYSDYVDFTDFLNKVTTPFKSETMQNLKNSLQKLIIANDVSPAYADAHGVAIWLPTTKYEFEEYQEKYYNLSFQSETLWGDALKELIDTTEESY